MQTGRKLGHDVCHVVSLPRFFRPENCQKDARGENTKINYGLDTTGEKEKRTSKKNVDGNSHDNKKFRTRSVEKQRGMVFGFRKTTTVVKKPDR